MTTSRLLLLPGNHPSQRQWIEMVYARLADLYDEAVAVAYAHWEREEAGFIDFDAELQRLARTVAPDRRWGLLGKSAGVLLGLMAVQRQIVEPEIGFFLGTPVTWARERGLNVTPLLQGFPGRAVFVQKSHDPVGHAQDLWDTLQEIGMARYEVIELPGADHDYADLERIHEIVARAKTENGQD
jgi:hypothetical protein